MHINYAHKALVCFKKKFNLETTMNFVLHTKTEKKYILRFSLGYLKLFSKIALKFFEKQRALKIKQEPTWRPTASVHETAQKSRV